MGPLGRRRPRPEQGHALEVLGHAIEYLVDRDLHTTSLRHDPNASETIQTLMRLNREVFAECREVVPIGQRVRNRICAIFERREHPVAAGVAGHRS